MSVKQTLTRVREILADPKAWIKHEDAGIRRDDGFISAPRRFHAHEPVEDSYNCFCLRGAIYRATDDVWERYDAKSALAEHLETTLTGSPGYDITLFNDHPDRQHSEVLALLDKAIAACP